MQYCPINGTVNQPRIAVRGPRRDRSITPRRRRRRRLACSSRDAANMVQKCSAQQQLYAFHVGQRNGNAHNFSICTCCFARMTRGTRAVYDIRFISVSARCSTWSLRCTCGGRIVRERRRRKFRVSWTKNMQNEASLIGPVARVSVMRARRATAKVEVRRVRHAYTNLMLLLAQLGGQLRWGSAALHCARGCKFVVIRVLC